MSSDITTTAAAEGETAATEGAPNVHAVEIITDVMMAGEHNCARCADYAAEIAIATERYDALTVAMKQQENDAIVSKALADERERQMFSSKAEIEAEMLTLQGAMKLKDIELQQSEQETRHARSELEQATENNVCFDPGHAQLQEDLDSAQLEIIEMRANEKSLDTKIASLKEKVAEAQNRSASALGRKVIQGRRESSGTHPTMSALLEEEEQGAGGEQSDMITGSELIVTGGIPKKEGSRRFTCFGNGNPYHDLVKESMVQADAEEDSSTESKVKHSILNMDTDVPKMLKQAMIISSDSDNMQEMKIKSRETMNISKFVTTITRQLRINKAEILAAETLGGFAEYQEVVGAVSGLNTWNRKIYAYLNTHHGEKFYQAVTEGGHKQMKIEFVKHARHGGSKDFDVLIKITGAVLAFNLLQSECKQIMKLLDTTKYAKESNEDFRLRAIEMCDTMTRKMDYCDLEDLAVAQIISQLDDSVEVHCSRLLALYTTGECGIEWILAIIDEMNKVTQRLGLRGKKNDNKDHSHQSNQSVNQSEQEVSECWRCGRKHDPSGCWSKEAVCHTCDQKGHISSRCQNVQDFRAKNQKRGKGAGKGKDKGKGKGKGVR